MRPGRGEVSPVQAALVARRQFQDDLEAKMQKPMQWRLERLAPMMNTQVLIFPLLRGSGIGDGCAGGAQATCSEHAGVVKPAGFGTVALSSVALASAVQRTAVDCTVSVLPHAAHAARVASKANFARSAAVHIGAERLVPAHAPTVLVEMAGRDALAQVKEPGHAAPPIPSAACASGWSTSGFSGIGRHSPRANENDGLASKAEGSASVAEPRAGRDLQTAPMQSGHSSQVGAAMLARALPTPNPHRTHRTCDHQNCWPIPR